MSCAPGQRFLATQTFQRIEAVYSGRSDPADPNWLHVRVTPYNALHEEIESALIKGGDPRGIDVLNPEKHPFRIFTGTWGYELSHALYEQGKRYTIHWRFSMLPDVLNVVRSNFTWDPAPERPREPDGCIVFGTLTRNRVPMGNMALTAEEYADFATLHRRLWAVDLLTDSFGNWWIETPKNGVLRVVTSEAVATKLVPSQDCVAFKDMADWRHDASRVDSFGYPMPGEAGANGETLESPLTGQGYRGGNC